MGESVDGSEHPERVCICAESTSKLHRKENLEKCWTGVEKKTYGLEKIAILLEIKTTIILPELTFVMGVGNPPSCSDCIVLDLLF